MLDFTERSFFSMYKIKSNVHSSNSEDKFHKFNLRKIILYIYYHTLMDWTVSSHPPKTFICWCPNPQCLRLGELLGWRKKPTDEKSCEMLTSGHDVAVAYITSQQLRIPTQDLQKIKSNFQHKWGRYHGPISIKGTIGNWQLLREVESFSFGDMAAGRFFMLQCQATHPCAYGWW